MPLVHAFIAIVFALPFLTHAASNELCAASPEWGIFITDYGYADRMVDLRQAGDLDFRGREYLSGEWAQAISYTKGANNISPTWLEPEFIFPDWSSNSTFSVTAAIMQTGSNASGLPIFESTISNGDIEITIASEVIDTVTGIQQGATAASAASIQQSPSTSGRYLLKQQYSYKNVSGQSLSNINIYQMLHSLASLAGLYDDRIYAGVNTANGPFNYDADFHFDSTLLGKDDENGSFVDPSPCLGSSISLQSPASDVFHIDEISLHSNATPQNFDNDYYGDQAAGDNHIFGQPFIGTHLNIEAAALNNIDFFDPGDTDYPTTPPFVSTLGETAIGDYWVASAQQHLLNDLAAGESQSFTYLLSLHSTTYDFRATENVPLPIFTQWLLLFISGGIFIYSNPSRAFCDK